LENKNANKIKKSLIKKGNIKFFLIKSQPFENKQYKNKLEVIIFSFYYNLKQKNIQELPKRGLKS